jgi:hypothetical protein
MYHNEVSSEVTRLFCSWSEQHPGIWLSVPIVKEKIVKYSQFHANQGVREAYGSAMPWALYDGGAEMWAESVEDLISVNIHTTILVS